MVGSGLLPGQALYSLPTTNLQRLPVPVRSETTTADTACDAAAGGVNSSGQIQTAATATNAAYPHATHAVAAAVAVEESYAKIVTVTPLDGTRARVVDVHPPPAYLGLLVFPVVPHRRLRHAYAWQLDQRLRFFSLRKTHNKKQGYYIRGTEWEEE